MKENELATASLIDLARALDEGTLTTGRLVHALVERIELREPDVRAWAYFDPELAFEEARSLDGMARRGPFHGLPVAVKDIIDTANIPTAYGSPIYQGYRPGIDASAVAAVRSAGGFVLGKTVTAEFAHRLPGETRNPLDLERTPGGSSSGSAAAVVDGMAPIALATQTTASTIRPASYCGLVGFKPSFGIISCQGIKQSAPSFDTIGIIGRTVSDCAFLRDILLEETPSLPESIFDIQPRIGFCRTPFWDLVHPEAQASIEAAVDRLRAAGSEIVDVDIPEAFSCVQDAHRCITSYELVRSLASERRENFEKLSSVLREGRLTEGARITVQQYIEAIENLERARAAARSFFAPFDCIVSPSTAGIAPKGLSSTGPSELCVLWTALHVPSLTLPLSARIDNMPLGLQIVGARGADIRLFEFAKWIECRI